MAQKKDINFEDIKKMYLEQGLTYKEIALKFDCSCNVIRRIAKRHKFKAIRGKSKHRKIIIQKSEINLSIPKFLSDTGINNKGMEVLLGSLLGDSQIRKKVYKSRISYNVYFANGEKQLDYLKYKYSFFQENEVNPIRIDIKEGWNIIKGKEYFRRNLYCFSTKVFDLSKIHNVLIKDGKKIVTMEYLKWLTPLSLAIWYQDDGSYHKQNKIVRLATMGFTQKCNNVLKEYFYDVLKMPCFLEKTKYGYKYSLVLVRSSTKKFLQLIEPYICESMKYKNPSETSKTENTVSREVL